MHKNDRESKMLIPFSRSLALILPSYNLRCSFATSPVRIMLNDRLVFLQTSGFDNETLTVHGPWVKTPGISFIWACSAVACKVGVSFMQMYCSRRIRANKHPKPD